MSDRIERCCACDEPTGRAGSSDDSLFTDQEGIGPFCAHCYDGARHAESVLLPVTAALRASLASVTKERDDFQTQAGARKRECFELKAEVAALKEELGIIFDTADNLLHAATLPVSNSIHVEGLRGGVEKIKKLTKPYSDDEEADRGPDNAKR